VSRSERELRTIFDEDTELYDRMRPAYPDRLFVDLVELVGLRPDHRLLEIGAGTGKATAPLSATGCRITALEPGPRLAAFAARRFARSPNVEVVNDYFETWPVPEDRFDVVASATAYHWLDPAVRVGKAAEVLRPGGVLAVIETHHVAGGTAQFFADVQDCYERFDPSTPPGLRLESADQVPRRADTAGSGWFEPAEFRRYPWEVTYSANEYVDLLRTYSGHRALPAPARAGLLDCVKTLIETRYGGRVTKRYLTQLWTARRRAEPD
jgi:SAM-dependent methyltransferase